MLNREFPARAQEGWRIRDCFDGALLVMAQRVGEARLEDTRITVAAQRARRLRKQFALLPEGTILVDRNQPDRIAIVSNRRGTRTKRSLILRKGGRDGRDWLIDADTPNRARFALVTPKRAGKARHALSAHERLEAVAQAQKLAPLYPDLV